MLIGLDPLAYGRADPLERVYLDAVIAAAMPFDEKRWDRFAVMVANRVGEMLGG